MPIVKINTYRSFPPQLLCRNLVVSLWPILGLLSGCNTSSPNQSIPGTDRSPKVVVTNTVLCDLTKQIAANTVNTICIIAAGSDPHIYQITPTDRKSIEEAKLILYGGYNLEPELIKTIKSTSNPALKIAVNEVAVPQPNEFAEDGKSTIDPHIWHNAKYGVKIAETIAANLAKIAPTRAATYQQNTNKLTAQIGQIDVWIKSQIATIPPAKKILFTTHDALGYYGTAYGLPIDALAGLSTDEKPNAARVKELIDKIEKTQVPTIFVEETLNPKVISIIARSAHVNVSSQKIYADGLGEANSPGGTYQKMLISNTKAIVEGLGGKFKPFGA
jgi:manganese/iron transport system substrate-binding protein